MPLYSLIKTSLLDYPGLVSSIVFTRGCNLRCPYCYNSELVVQQGTERFHQGTCRFFDVTEIQRHLELRKDKIQGLVLTGGEPLLDSGIKDLISYAHDLGYKVKLDTNGTNPCRLESLVSREETRPDYIAMDIKTSPRKYDLLLSGSGVDINHVTQALKDSVTIIRSYDKSQREWRTVLVPSIVEAEDIVEMASLLPEDASWFLSPFRSGNCLKKEYDSISPYSQEKFSDLVNLARQYIKGATAR